MEAMAFCFRSQISRNLVLDGRAVVQASDRLDAGRDGQLGIRDARISDVFKLLDGVGEAICQAPPERRLRFVQGLQGMDILRLRLVKRIKVLDVIGAKLS